MQEEEEEGWSSGTQQYTTLDIFNILMEGAYFFKIVKKKKKGKARVLRVFACAFKYYWLG